MRTPRSRIASARSVISSACSWTCAARPGSLKTGCRSTPFSSSTVSSVRCRRRSSFATASPTSSGATDKWPRSAPPPPQAACRQGGRGGAIFSANVDELNRFLSHDLREPIRFGIGIHGGEVIIGDIGYRDHMVFTALGDAVNVAARLQDMTKNLACEVVLSEEVQVTAGLAGDTLPRQEVAIRGRAEPMMVRIVAHAKDLSALVDATDVAAA